MRDGPKDVGNFAGDDKALACFRAGKLFAKEVDAVGFDDTSDGFRGVVAGAGQIVSGAPQVNSHLEVNGGAVWSACSRSLTKSEAFDSGAFQGRREESGGDRSGFALVDLDERCRTRRGGGKRAGGGQILGDDHSGGDHAESEETG